ncbi:CRISPR-associated endonuclease Cas2 [Litorilinea aerophila]|uniref:CRISPR-associated endoribonuclease Cas2 n=1 Tax=Litorilinea aerophila TaxID=1204385 RepID=A0A540VD89_9CHLR|nr:CRISPR-associated endonuclease Cas2 [Litorilinea aerophila]MCC9077508.1 CRISPR-associated endonuclease Cas2 [Litorilinea aerophila]
MRCLLIYDIPDDRVRTRIADFCLDYGLDRIQYSAFVGELSSNHQEELMLKIQQRLGNAAGKVELFPICRQDWRSRLSIEQSGPAVDGKEPGSGRR